MKRENIDAVFQAFALDKEPTPEQKTGAAIELLDLLFGIGESLGRIADALETRNSLR